MPVMRHFTNLCAPKGYTKNCVECGLKLIEGKNMFVNLDSTWGKLSRPHCFKCACKKDKTLKERYKFYKEAPDDK